MVDVSAPTPSGVPMAKMFREAGSAPPIVSAEVSLTMTTPLRPFSKGASPVASVPKKLPRTTLPPAAVLK